MQDVTVQVEVEYAQMGGAENAPQAPVNEENEAVTEPQEAAAETEDEEAMML